MTLDLTSTNASQIAAALLTERRKAGSPAMGMVMTLVVVTDEQDHYDALKVARAVSREHPARILGVIRRSHRGRAELDAEISVGGSGESVLLRMKGELADHAESVVLPLLLPDSPVVVWWPSKAPADPAHDALGVLAQRRITDASAMERGKTQAILTQARTYADGNTDLAWTRLTPWRALLAAALDQYPAKVRSGEVSAERLNPSADLLVAWLADRLHVEITRTVSKGPGITSVVLLTGGGPIEISRPDGRLAMFTIPNAPDRPVALRRRDTAELLAEELRRLDPDDIYAETVKRLRKIADTHARTTAKPVKDLPRRPATATSPSTGAASAKTSTSTGSTEKRSAERGASEKTSAKRPSAQKRSAKKAAAKKAAAKGAAAKKTSGKKTSPRKTSASASAASTGR
jgi:glucose-6-phosphate dehydrogenase assembly protein OpcA